MRKLILSVLFLALTLSAFSQSLTALRKEPPRLSEAATVSLVTIFPGKAVYAAFGHTAFRIHDPDNSIDLLYNYGQSIVPFDAAFVPRFVSGNMEFILGVVSTRRAFEFYQTWENRTIREQTLDLSSDEKNALFEFLVHNARPENRAYIYDFFFDNCATRVRDVMQTVFGSSIRLSPERTRKLSFRQEIAPYLETRPWIGLGVDLALGPRTDGTADDGASMFLPLRVMSAFEHGVIGNADGTTRPLTSRTELIYESTAVPAVSWWSSPLLPVSALLLLAFFLAFRTRWARTERTLRTAARVARGFDAVLFSVAGLGGLAISLIWMFSGYEVVAWNLNLLWLLPTHAAVPFLLGERALSRQTVRKILTWYFGLTLALAVGVALAKPFLPQHIPAAAVPLILVFAARSADRLRELRTRGNRESGHGAGTPHRDADRQTPRT